MTLNRNLAIIALVLLVASVWTYLASTSTTDSFERGRRLLPNLNPDDVAEITIATGDDEVTLTRADDGFTVADVHDYPATNQSVNRVLRTLAELELEKRVGTGDDLYRDLGLTVDAEGMVEVALKSSAGADMVRLRVGSAFEGGGGNYLRRIDGDGGPAYLSARSVSFNADPETYLDTEIVRVESDEIQSIEGPDFRIVRRGDGLELEDVPRGMKEKPAAVNRVKNLLRGLRFDEVYLADADEVRGLQPRQALDARLTDGSGYRIALAERDDGHFIQIAGYHTVDRVSVDRDESEEELEDKAAILSRADEINRFNRFHGSWVYRINETTAEALDFSEADLIEDAG